MSFLLKWLGLTIEKPAGVAVRPSRTLELALPYGMVFERCVRGLEEALGAQVGVADPQTGCIEASFGLIFSERLACCVRRIDDQTTSVTIESRRIAGSPPTKELPVLDRWEKWVREGR